MASDARTDSALGTLRDWLLNGAALTVPMVVTVLVLGFVVNFLLNVVSPVVTLVRLVPGMSPVIEGLVVQVASLVSILALVLAVGAVANLTESTYAPKFHATVEGLPGIGQLYRSFRRMSDVFVESDSENFQEVKLVEFPQDGAYSLAFVTAETPEKVQSAAGELQMQTLFVPLAPNPVMGGFLVNFAADRIYEVDLTVEEAIESIVTSGVSTGAADRDGDRPMSMDSLSEMTMDPVENSAAGGDGRD